MKELFIKHREGVLYLLFGVFVTLANWITYAFFVTVTDLGVTVSNAIAWFVAVVSAFITNKLFVFESRATDIKTIIKEAVSFLTSRVITGVFEILAPAWLIAVGLSQTLFDIDGFFAKLIVSIIVVVLNYVLSKLIVFRKK